MGVLYTLVNQTKKETINFSHLPVGKMREIAGNPASAAVVAWYLLTNPGDDIQFVSDTYDDWPFISGKRDDYLNYPDKTEQLISILIKEGILQDSGFDYKDEEDPENVYVRAIKNVWMGDEEP